LFQPHVAHSPFFIRSPIETTMKMPPKARTSALYRD